MDALKVGFRHIDTAQLYRNEAEVGQGIKQSDGAAVRTCSSRPRSQHPGETTEETYERCLESIKKLDDREGGYVDLFLIHNANIGPFQRKDVWGVLERLQAEGKIKAIGVSNYGPRASGGDEGVRKDLAADSQPDRGESESSLTERAAPRPILHVTDLLPQLHPWGPAEGGHRVLREERHHRGGLLPMVRNRRSDNPTLVSVADKLGVTPNQILLRYCLQKGIARR